MRDLQSERMWYLLAIDFCGTWGHGHFCPQRAGHHEVCYCRDEGCGAIQ